MFLPRPFHVIVLFTSSRPGDGCTLCSDSENAFEVVAAAASRAALPSRFLDLPPLSSKGRSLEQRDNAGSLSNMHNRSRYHSRVVFVVADFSAVHQRSIFHLHNISTVPFVAHIRAINEHLAGLKSTRFQTDNNGGVNEHARDTLLPLPGKPLTVDNIVEFVEDFNDDPELVQAADDVSLHEREGINCADTNVMEENQDDENEENTEIPFSVARGELRMAVDAELKRNQSWFQKWVLTTLSSLVHMVLSAPIGAMAGTVICLLGGAAAVRYMAYNYCGCSLCANQPLERWYWMGVSALVFLVCTGGLIFCFVNGSLVRGTPVRYYRDVSFSFFSSEPSNFGASLVNAGTIHPSLGQQYLLEGILASSFLLFGSTCFWLSACAVSPNKIGKRSPTTYHERSLRRRQQREEAVAHRSSSRCLTAWWLAVWMCLIVGATTISLLSSLYQSKRLR